MDRDSLYLSVGMFQPQTVQIIPIILEGLL
jgi:hypothetical protein